MSSPRVILVQESYQAHYQYRLDEPTGSHFQDEFNPDLTPKEMLSLGIFGGYYTPFPMREFPPDWYQGVNFSANGRPDPKLNYFKVNASQPLSEWQRKGWIYPEDPLGWFQWYCRYYQGRRIGDEDLRQIKRWKNMKRHVCQLQRCCQVGDVLCQPRRRQALLHWAYDSRRL